MDQRLLLGVLQAERRLTDEIARLRDGERALLFDMAFQGDAGDEFHHEVMGIPGAIGVEDLDDIGMAEARRGLSFTAKAAHRFLVLQAVFADDLDGKDAAILQTPGAIDDPHAAAADLFENLEIGQVRRRLIVVGGSERLPGTGLQHRRHVVGLRRRGQTAHGAKQGIRPLFPLMTAHARQQTWHPHYLKESRALRPHGPRVPARRALS